MPRQTRSASAEGLPVVRATPSVAVLFVVLVLALSSLRFIPVIVEEATGTALSTAVVDLLLPTLGAFAPLWAALIVSSRRAGGSGVRALLGQVLRWRTGPAWYAIALLGPLLLFGSALLAALLAGASPPPLGVEELAGGAAIFVAALVFLIGEEYGWRGFLQPALQARWSALAAALLVGVVWAAWHAPLFFDREAAQAGVPPLAFLALGVGLSVIMAWVYNSTGGSLLIVILAHAAVNASLGTIAINLPDVDSVARYVIASAVAVWAVALVLIVAAGPRRLSTGAVWPDAPAQAGR